MARVSDESDFIIENEISKCTMSENKKINNDKNYLFSDDFLKSALDLPSNPDVAPHLCYNADSVLASTTHYAL